MNSLQAGTFWQALAAGRVRDAPNADGEVVAEMNKGDVANVIAQDGDWIQVQNYWDSKPAVWLMYQNKKGKQLAEAAPDQVDTIFSFFFQLAFTL